eukprot:590921-Rhodomonas_salina.1
MEMHVTTCSTPPSLLPSFPPSNPLPQSSHLHAAPSLSPSFLSCSPSLLFPPVRPPMLQPLHAPHLSLPPRPPSRSHSRANQKGRRFRAKQDRGGNVHSPGFG